MRIDVVTNPVLTLQPGTTFAADSGPFVAQDTESIKPALLYADSVRLRSYLIDVVRFAHAAAEQGGMPLRALRLLLSLSIASSDEVLAAYGMDPGQRPSRDQMRETWRRQLDGTPDETFRLLDEFADEHWSWVQPLAVAYFGSARTFVEDLDLSPMDAALDAGVLEIDGWTPGGPGWVEREQDYVDRASEHLFEVDAGSMMLFDRAVAEGHRVYWGEEARRPGGEVTATLLRKLPGFQRASIAELIDIRTELRGPLVRFRVFADELEGGAAGVSRDDLPAYVDECVRAEIDPALAEIEDLIADNHYLRLLSDGATAKEGWIPAVGGVALGLGELSGVGALLTASAGIASVPLRALLDWTKGRREVQRHPLFLLRHLSRP